MKRTDLMDTSPWAHREMVRRLREMTPEQRAWLTVEAIELGLQIDRLARERLRNQANDEGSTRDTR